MSWQFLGITFYAYGLIIGLAISVGIWLVENKAKQLNLKINWSQLIIWEILFGLMGARIYHLLTDYQLYLNDFWAVFYVWNGGLSIIGAILGAVVGLLWYEQITKKRINKLQILDLAIYGLPIGQAIGRVGNYVNQELYGLPTNFFWKIYIDPIHRLPAYRHLEFYHPLFLYEAILMLLFAGSLWIFDHRGNKAVKKIGSGNLFIYYALYYCFIRFFLEFLRLEKRIVMGGLSINQLIMVGLIMILLIYQTYQKKLNEKK